MPSPAWCARAVALVRATRDHPDLRIGASVRGAIDLGGLAHQLARARGTGAEDWHVGLDAALVALSGRIRVAEASVRSPEDVVTELYRDVFGPPPEERGADDEDAADGGGGAGEARPRP